MLDKDILDKLIPLKTQDELKEEIREKLVEKGFAITNFRSGGIAYTIIMIFIKIYIELVTLARTIVSNSTISNADEDWLIVKAKDFSKERKQASYTYGNVTLTREDTEQTIKIKEGEIFKTEQDRAGEEFRYIVQETTVFPKGESKVKVLVKAEKPGASYNVSKNMITKSLSHIETVDQITNDEDWITKEGADIEYIESFRSRVLNSWAELSTNVIADKYKNVAEGVVGVLHAQVDDKHPRGQGTVDIIITSTAGQATESLLTDVSKAVEEIRGPYDNLLVKSSEVVYQDIEAVIEIDSLESDEGIQEAALNKLKELLEINATRELNQLYIADIIYVLKGLNVNTAIKNVKVIQPSEDVVMPLYNVICLGNLQVTVNRT